MRVAMRQPGFGIPCCGKGHLTDLDFVDNNILLGKTKIVIRTV